MKLRTILIDLKENGYVITAIPCGDMACGPMPADAGSVHESIDGVREMVVALLEASKGAGAPASAPTAAAS